MNKSKTDWWMLSYTDTELIELMKCRCVRGAPVSTVGVADDSSQTSVCTLWRRTKTLSSSIPTGDERWSEHRAYHPRAQNSTLAISNWKKQKSTTGSAQPRQFPQAVKASSQDSGLIYSQRHVFHCPLTCEIKRKLFPGQSWQERLLVSHALG